MAGYSDFMREAIRIVDSRGKNYGPVEDGLSRASEIMYLISGVRLTVREIALTMHAIKLARMYEAPEMPDNYTDGVNYLAFAGVANATAQKEASANRPTVTVTPPTPLKPLDLASRIGTTAVASVASNNENGG